MAPGGVRSTPAYSTPTTAHRRVMARLASWSSAPDSGYLALCASIAGYLPRFTFPEQSALPIYDRDLSSFFLASPATNCYVRINAAHSCADHFEA